MNSIPTGYDLFLKVHSCLQDLGGKLFNSWNSN